MAPAEVQNSQKHLPLLRPKTSTYDSRAVFSTPSESENLCRNPKLPIPRPQTSSEPEILHNRAVFLSPGAAAERCHSGSVFLDELNSSLVFGRVLRRLLAAGTGARDRPGRRHRWDSRKNSAHRSRPQIHRHPIVVCMDKYMALGYTK